MKTPFAVAAAVLAAAFAGCRRTHPQEFTVSLPGLVETNSAIVAATVRALPGVDGDSLKFDFAGKTLTLVYDSMQVAKTNIRMAIAERGVEVEFPTNATGRAGYIDSRK